MKGILFLNRKNARIDCFHNNLLTIITRQRITENGHIFAALIQTN